MSWLERALRWWCVMMHSQITRPFRGRYQCMTCFRVYPVTWEETPVPAGMLRHKRHHWEAAKQVNDGAVRRVEGV